MGLDVRSIDQGWEVAAGPSRSTSAGEPADLEWIPASVPGTVARAFRDAGRAVPDDLDERDWWFRTRFHAAAAEAGEELVLRFGGIATLAEILLDGERIATSESMFAAVDIDVTDRLGGSHELVIRCLALAPRLAEPRKPRARWRTAVVADGNLRWFRTTLLGRAPGFAPGPPVVGPFRPVRLERRSGIVVDDLRVRARLAGEDGRLTVTARLRSLDGSTPETVSVELDGPSGRHATTLAIHDADGAITAQGEVTVPRVAVWWPHTHGEPNLHAVRLIIGSGDAATSVEGGRVGFRALAAGADPHPDIEQDGLAIHIGGLPIFVRGAVWTPVDPVALATSSADLRRSLELVRDAGMNMLRIPGTGLYETAEFHDLCDELGILVWQDLLFANLDYPFADDAFRTVVDREVAEVLGALAPRPSAAVVCGNSEVEQQVAMLGLDPALGRDPFYREGLSAAANDADLDAVLVPSAPFGGDLPFRPDRGVANYYGVGGYRRPLSDARTAGVRFAAECLAFSNIPDGPTTALDDPEWKAGVPRDRGADWDFEDVRDHYLELLYGVDASALRRDDPSRYLALSRAVSGEVMGEVFGEWRRAGSPTAGGLVLWWRDVVPGAGWGLVDRDGTPKVAYHQLRRALAPVAIWTTDEGLGGVAVHVANDRPERLVARLRVALYRDLEIPVGAGERLLEVPPHGTTDLDVEAVIGHFVDAAWAYRFGPPAQDLIVATLEPLDGDAARPISQAFRFPLTRPSVAETGASLGLDATVVETGTDATTIEIRTRRLAHHVRLVAPGFTPEDDAFSVEPGHARLIDLRPAASGTPFRGGTVTAVNLDGVIEIEQP
jgi:beta-mannosidase